MTDAYEKIEARATRLLREADALAQPVDLKRILAHLKLKLVAKPMEQEYSGFLAVEKGVIAVNSRHALVRRRFTVAHEIGHYHLHRKRQDAGAVFIDRTVYFRADSLGNENRKMELEANAYAARLLVPKILLEQYFEAHTSVDLSQAAGIKLLAEEFNVSRDAMKYRLQDLGYILPTSF